MKLESWLNASLDVLTQHRALSKPLDGIVRAMLRERHLGSHDRRLLQDAIFSWARHHRSVEELLKKGMGHRYDTMIPRRDRDLLVLLTVLGKQALLPESLLALAQQYGLENKAVESDFPAWFVSAIQVAYSEEAVALLSSLQERAQTCLAIDVTKMSADTVRAGLEKIGVRSTLSPLLDNALVIESPRFQLSALPKAIQDAVWPMDHSSQLAASKIAAKPGERILDACAGGGGKTRYMLRTGADIVAMDVSPHRLEATEKRIGHYDRVRFVLGDATEPPFGEQTFDWILVDAPCSGTGTLRRAPDLLDRLDAQKIAEYTVLQKKILTGVLPLLKPGGSLVYATCSLLPAENQQIVAELLRNNPQMAESAKMVQLLPSTDNSDGFFISVLKRSLL